MSLETGGNESPRVYEDRLKESLDLFTQSQELFLEATESWFAYPLPNKLSGAGDAATVHVAAFRGVVDSITNTPEIEDKEKSFMLGGFLEGADNDRIARLKAIAPTAEFLRIEDESLNNIEAKVLNLLKKDGPEAASKELVERFVLALQADTNAIANALAQTPRGKAINMVRKSGEFIKRSTPSAAEVGKTTLSIAGAITLAHFAIKNIEKRSSDR